MSITENTESPQDKVFGLPELCENILFHLGDSQDILHGIPLNDPIKQLFVLQRVSRTFKGIIEGSRKLRKLMWLVSVNATPRDVDDSDLLRRLKISPLGWLLYETSCCGGVIGTAIGGEPAPYNVESWKPLQLPSGSRVRWNIKGLDYPGASWRNMKALLVHSGRDVEVQLDVKEDWREGRYPQYEEYTRQLRVKEEDKLSVVFDWVQELDRERPAKRCAQARSLERRSTSTSKIMRRR